MPELQEKPNGAARAAILLMSLGELQAAEILKHMGPREVHTLGVAMAALKSVPREQVNAVLEEFLAHVSTHTSLGVGSEDYIRKVMESALGNDRAGPMLNRILSGDNPRGLDALKWMDAPSIAQLVREEHPQIMAIVLAHLEPDLAAEVLALLPEGLRSELVSRVVTLEAVPPTALNELDALLDRRFNDNPNIQSARVGGLRRAADILNFLDASVESDVLSEIKEADPELAERLDEALFVFDNLLDVEDRGLQALLREIATDSLVIALKGADERLREKFFHNMSKRAAELLRDDLEAKGPVRLAEVEQAQKEIIAAARKLAETGVISLGKGDDFV